MNSITSQASAPYTLRFPRELPITAHVRAIMDAIHGHQVVIVAGETGSGKTTQLPKICLAMGRGEGLGRIGVTQPRRIAATSVATRVAAELEVELGREVGYQIRFADRTSAVTRVKFMTDGVLLSSIHRDPLLLAYDTIILDEAHERSLTIDFLLGYLRTILPQRPDLRVIVSSATLATDRFSEFFGNAPVISVSGRAYPVEVVYRPPPNERMDLASWIADTVDAISRRDNRGDILVFLPGEREIRETAAELQGRTLGRTSILPLYGRLPVAEQARIFQTSSERRIVLATNVAETSLTIPGIVYVIDVGLARINRHEQRTGVTQLLVEPISRASADQRKGRAGRTQSGVCFRLYDRRDFDRRPAFTDPEVFRVGLASAILQMKALGLGDIESFPFLDPPPKRAIEEGYRTLEELGALDGERILTDIGKKLSRLPVDPRLGRMILGGAHEGALSEVLIIAAALGIQDPRDRPPGAQRQADDAHERFRDEVSDFKTLLAMWRFFHQDPHRSEADRRRLCRDHFLSIIRMREWSDTHDQLVRVAKELGFEPAPLVGSAGVPHDVAGKTKDAAQIQALIQAKDDALHRAVLSGLLSRVGMWHPEQRVYLGARQTKFQLHPASALARKKPPAWVLTAELVETTQLFARTAAKIDPAWLEAAGGSRCKRSYSEPNWAKSSAQVMNREQVTLFGMTIVRDRKVHYGPIDPRVSRRLFLLHALVRQEYQTAKVPPFMAHNRALFDEVRNLRDRARRSDMIADDDAIALFFEKRVPDEVYSGATFETWRVQAEAQDPTVLQFGLGDILLNDSAHVSRDQFPDSLSLATAHGTLVLPLSYRFEPGEEDDGIALTLQVSSLNDLDPDVLEWTIPGWHEEKILQLCQSLPPAFQKALGKDIKSLAATIATKVKPFVGSMRKVLSEVVAQQTGVQIPLYAWNVDALSPYLRFFLRLMDGKKVLAEGRDLRELQERFAGRQVRRSAHL